MELYITEFGCLKLSTLELYIFLELSRREIYSVIEVSIRKICSSLEFRLEKYTGIVKVSFIRIYSGKWYPIQNKV
jgi:hypothetical protein